VAKPLPESIVDKMPKAVVGDLIVFDLIRDRIGMLGLAASEAFFALENECDLLKNGIGSGSQMPYRQFEPKVQNLIAKSDNLIELLEAEIVRTKQILGEE